MSLSYKKISLRDIFAIILILIHSAILNAELKSSAHIENLSLISSDYDKTSDKNFNLIGMSFKSNNHKSEIFNLDLIGLYAFKNSNLSFVNLKEVYFKIQLDSTSTLSLGRKLNQWSKLDENWNLGFYQAQNRWNSLHSESQGLFGLFYEKTYLNWKVLAYGSGIFVPDQGASYELQNGEFVGANPFFVQPPKEISYDGVINPIKYNIEKPETSEILFQPSYGFQIEYNPDENGLYSSLSGMYKPSNQLAIGWKGYSVVAEYARVDIKPKSYYEKIMSADLGARFDHIDLSVSTLHQNSDKPKFESDYNGPVFTNYNLLGAQIKILFENIYFGSAFYSKNSGEISDEGPNQGQIETSFTQKIDLTNMYSVFFGLKIMQKQSYLWNSIISYKEGDDGVYQQIEWNNHLDIKGPFKFLSKLILVEVASENSELNYKRDLDQLSIGVQYDL